MSWFLIALLASLCWSITNHTDKYIIQKYFKASGIGGYTTFGILIGLVFLVGIWIARPLAPVSTGSEAAIILMASGLALSLGILLYVYSLSRDDASAIVPYFQTIPIFAYAIEYSFLGVRLTNMQLLGSAIILGAALLISLDLTEKRPRVKFNILIAMLTSSLLISLNHILFKVGSMHATATPDYWNNSFWQYVGTMILGLLLFIFIKRYRDEFFSILKNNARKILALQGGNEIFNESGNRLIQYAILFTPVTLAQVVNGFQPAFVFIIGLMLTIFFPHIAKEKIERRHLAQKIIVIIIMIIGAYIMNI